MFPAYGGQRELLPAAPLPCSDPVKSFSCNPSSQCKYLVKEVRNQSGKYCIQKFRKKKTNQNPTLVWVIPELSTHTSEQSCSCSGAGTIEKSKANLLCGWRERGMGEPSPSVGSCRGLSQAQDKALSPAQSPVPCTSWPPLTQTSTKPGSFLSSALQMFMGVFTEHFKKVPVSEACLHVLNLMSFQKFQ